MSASELTTKERQQLLAVLREMHQVPASDPPERRRENRRKVLLNLWIRKIKQGTIVDGRATGDVDMFTGTVVNVASKGVALIVRKSLNKEDKFVLPLRFQEGGGWLVLCEVRNVSRLESGRYKIGAQFMDRIEDPEGTAKVPLDWVM